MHEQTERRDAAETAEHRPLSIRNVARILRAYLPAIALSLLALGMAYTIYLGYRYVSAPIQRTVSLPFRLQFAGSEEGNYPNGRKFSSGDVVVTPVLLQVYRNNDLKRYMSFDRFTHSIVVLEANSSLERLATEYRARLADPRLSPVDRERIEREFRDQRESLAKNEYTLTFLASSDTAQIPDNVIKKALVDVLATWSRMAIMEQHILTRNIALFSPTAVIPSKTLREHDALSRVMVLRTNATRVLLQIDELRKVPGMDLVRSRGGLSLAELQIRLEQIVRYELEPLLTSSRAATLATDPSSAIAIVEIQKKYDERQLRAAQSRVDAIRQAVAVYTAQSPPPETPRGTPQQPAGEAGATPETLVPQVSDTFIDRVVALAQRSNDVEFRKRMAEDLRGAWTALIPLEQAVAFDTQVLAALTSGRAGGDRQQVAADIARIESEIQQVVTETQEILKRMTEMMNPSSEIYSLVPPTVQTQRMVSMKNLAAYGVILMLIALPLILLAVFVHYKLTSEDEEDDAVRATPSPATH